MHKSVFLLCPNHGTVLIVVRERAALSFHQIVKLCCRIEYHMKIAKVKTQVSSTQRKCMI
jgi:hypothetical protein